jgi:conjugative transposon TraN protein
MKTRFLFLTVLFLTAFSSTAVQAQTLPVIDLPENVSLHFISPEPIRYVDISTESISGDLPMEKVLRIKCVADSLLSPSATDLQAETIVTIAAESFIAQYKIRYVPQQAGREFQTRIDILPEHMKPLESGVGLSRIQLEKLASGLLFRKLERDIARTKAFGIEGNVNHLATFSDYIFIDVGYQNKTNLKFDTDEVRFKIEDERVTKASTVQAIEIKPEYTLFKNPAFRKNFRNVYVFKKFSFPGHKVLKIELNEKQISGRVIIMKLKYKDLLDADIL